MPLASHGGSTYSCLTNMTREPPELLLSEPIMTRVLYHCPDRAGRAAITQMGEMRKKARLLRLSHLQNLPGGNQAETQFIWNILHLPQMAERLL